MLNWIFMGTGFPWLLQIKTHTHLTDLSATADLLLIRLKIATGEPGRFAEWPTVQTEWSQSLTSSGLLLTGYSSSPSAGVDLAVVNWLNNAEAGKGWTNTGADPAADRKRKDELIQWIYAFRDRVQFNQGSALGYKHKHKRSPDRKLLCCWKLKYNLKQVDGIQTSSIIFYYIRWATFYCILH